MSLGGPEQGGVGDMTLPPQRPPIQNPEQQALPCPEHIAPSALQTLKLADDEFDDVPQALAADTAQPIVLPIHESGTLIVALRAPATYPYTGNPTATLYPPLAPHALPQLSVTGPGWTMSPLGLRLYGSPTVTHGLQDPLIATLSPVQQPPYIP